MLTDNVVCKSYCLLGHSNVTENKTKTKKREKNPEEIIKVVLSSIHIYRLLLYLPTISPNENIGFKYMGSKVNNTIIHTIFI